MADTSTPPVPMTPADRSPLKQRRRLVVREVLVLQAKLILEGLRDVVLGPISIGAALIDLATDDERPGRLLERVLRAGIRFDIWLDLFGGLPRLAEAAEEDPEGLPPSQGVDRWFDRIEGALVEEVEKGELSKAALARVERVLGRTPR